MFSFDEFSAAAVVCAVRHFSRARPGETLQKRTKCDFTLPKKKTWKAQGEQQSFDLSCM